MPGLAAGAGSFFSGMSVIMHSVVSNRPATEAAFCRAQRVTFFGSMMPASVDFFVVHFYGCGLTVLNLDNLIIREHIACGRFIIDLRYNVLTNA